MGEYQHPLKEPTDNLGEVPSLLLLDGLWDEDGRINTGGFWERSLLERRERPAENVDVRRGSRVVLDLAGNPELLITSLRLSSCTNAVCSSIVLIPLDIRYVSGCMFA